MGIPASELEERMTEAELVEHMLDDRIEPWGPLRQDIHAAQIATTVANMSGHLKRPVKIQDMLLRFSRPPVKEMSAAQIRGNMLFWLGKPKKADR